MPRRRKSTTRTGEKSIGKRLSEFRKHRGLTQAEVGKKLGIHQTLVSQYERGTLRLHAALVADFAKVLRVSSDEILGLAKPPPNGSFRDCRFLRRMQKIDNLSRRQKLVLLSTIDTFLKGASVK